MDRREILKSGAGALALVGGAAGPALRNGGRTSPGSAARRQLELTLHDLKTGYEKVEIAAVCQCSGNRRGFSDPHMPGVEWGNGAIGNAKWAACG